MKYSDMTLGTIEAVVNKLGGEDGVRRFLAGELMLTASPTAIVAANPDLLIVDYSQTLAQMIADGHYDWVNSNIRSARFPLAGQGVEEVEFKEFHFDFDLESDDAKTRIEAADTVSPWMPAKIEHLLAFGKQFPEKQRQYPIVALGSVGEVYGDLCVPYLDRRDASRGLSLLRRGGRWGRSCRFLAVRKKVLATQT